MGGRAVVGLASGFFAGASHTPIIGTLLPVLFALIGGTNVRRRIGVLLVPRCSVLRLN